MTIADRPKKRAGHDVQTFGTTDDWANARATLATEYTLRGVDLSDALGVTGLDWDGMIDLVRERSMLARVREAHGDPEMSTQGGEHTGWSVCHGSDRGEADAVAHGGTEQDALQSALECAP